MEEVGFWPESETEEGRAEEATHHLGVWCLGTRCAECEMAHPRLSETNSLVKKQPLDFQGPYLQDAFLYLFSGKRRHLLYTSSFRNTWEQGSCPGLASQVAITNDLVTV